MHVYWAGTWPPCHLMREQWILGGYEAETRKGFLVPVPARDQATLLPIIKQWVCTQHNDMDGYKGSISEPATAWVCPRHG
eukprot:gene6337-11770_t